MTLLRIAGAAIPVALVRRCQCGRESGERVAGVPALVMGWCCSTCRGRTGRTIWQERAAVRLLGRVEASR